MYDFLPNQILDKHMFSKGKFRHSENSMFMLNAFRSSFSHLVNIVFFELSWKKRLDILMGTARERASIYAP